MYAYCRCMLSPNKVFSIGTNDDHDDGGGEQTPAHQGSLVSLCAAVGYVLSSTGIAACNAVAPLKQKNHLDIKLCGARWGLQTLRGSIRNRMRNRTYCSGSGRSFGNIGPNGKHIGLRTYRPCSDAEGFRMHWINVALLT